MVTPLACRLASKDELKAYANVLKQQGKGSIEVALTKKIATVNEDEYELLDLLLTESGRPVTWLAMASTPRHPERALETLTRLEPLIKRGGIPQILCKPFVSQLDLRNPFTFADNEVWGRSSTNRSRQQKKIYADPEFRAPVPRQPQAAPSVHRQWHRVEILEATNPALKQYEGKTVQEVAEMRDADPLDTFLDLALEDDLNLQYTMQQYHEDGIQQLITDPRTMIGLSDGGAHVDMLCDAGYATYLLGNWVRKREAVTLEFAVKRITSEPANFFGIRERGQLKKGWKADITVFDANTVNSARRATMAA